MNAFDIITIIVLIVAGFFGWRRGLISQIGSIFALILGIVACRAWGADFSQWLAPVLGLKEGCSETAATLGSVLANIILFIIVYIIVLLVARLLRGIVHGVLLGPLDSIGGAAFMAFKWLLGVSILLNLYVMISPDCEAATAAGTPTAYVRELAPWLMGVLQ